MILRPYQERAIAGLRAAYRAGQRAPCLVSPTGSGKTLILAAIIVGAIAKGNPVLFLAHRKELIDQSVSKLRESGVTSMRVIRADHDDGDPDAPVTVASIPTLAGKRWRDRLPEAGLVILDECHHVTCRSWRGLAGSYPRARLLGTTATPQRGDGAALGDVFDALVVAASVRELTPQYLVPLRVWAPSEPLAAGRLALSPLDAYRRHAPGRRAIVFATRIADAARYAAELTAGGVPAEVVHGELADARREEGLARFRAGELRALVNCGVLTEGTDIPAADACIMARAPQHAGLLLQCAGRVLRLSPETGKRDAVLVDLCGSVLIHGTPDMDREYTLDGRGISRPDRLAIRQCAECGGVFEAGPAVCPVCGAPVTARRAKAPRVTGEGVAEVVDLTGRRAGILRRNLELLAAEHGFEPAWVERTAAAIGGQRLPWVAGARPRAGKVAAGG